MAMPWPLARDLAEADARIERARLLDISIAMRAAQADEQGWKKWVESVSA